MEEINKDIEDIENYNKDTKELDEVIADVAIKNNTILAKDDPVLIFYTMGKYLFNTYHKKLTDIVTSIEFNQEHIIDDFKIFLDERQKKYEDILQANVNVLNDKIKQTIDRNSKIALAGMIDIVDKTEKKVDELYKNISFNNLTVKILVLLNIVISGLLLYLVLF